MSLGGQGRGGRYSEVMEEFEIEVGGKWNRGRRVLGLEEVALNATFDAIPTGGMLLVALYAEV